MEIVKKLNLNVLHYYFLDDFILIFLKILVYYLRVLYSNYAKLRKRSKMGLFKNFKGNF